MFTEEEIGRRLHQEDEPASITKFVDDASHVDASSEGKSTFPTPGYSPLIYTFPETICKYFISSEVTQERRGIVHFDDVDRKTSEILSATNSEAITSDYGLREQQTEPPIPTRRVVPRQSKIFSVQSDLKTVSPYTAALPEKNDVRIHRLYSNPVVSEDGFYHCPWEGQEICGHKPNILKCNYDKFIDSHIKPYRCKVIDCKNLSFSSIPCLLRHEREAHGMHGHGNRPFLCIEKGCDRSVEGNGFPRHWNLRDHERRAHGASHNTGIKDCESKTQETSRAIKKREVADQST